MVGIWLTVSLVLLAAEAWAGTRCPALHDRHDALLQRAHRAEVALVQAQRRRLCLDLEQLAEQLQATPQPATSRPVLDFGAYRLDFGAYSQCRQRAEQVLARQRPVLYRNPQGLPYYTPEGARLARQAADLQNNDLLSCRGVSSDPTYPAAKP